MFFFFFLIQIGWVKTDSKAIQAIHDHVITHNPRVWVSTTDQSTWNLHIKNVQEEDRGQYMCQINTDPMKSQVGQLNHIFYCLSEIQVGMSKNLPKEYN